MRSEQFETFEYVLTEIDIFLCYKYSAALLWRLHAKSFECFLTANEYFNLSFIAKNNFHTTYIYFEDVFRTIFAETSQCKLQNNPMHLSVKYLQNTL